MAKPKHSSATDFSAETEAEIAKENERKSAEEERAGDPSVAYGGVTKKTAGIFTRSISAINAKMSKLKGDLSADWKSFEDKGGNKWAMKLAHKFNDMDVDTRRKNLRDFMEYLDALENMSEMQMSFAFTDERTQVELLQQEGKAPIAAVKPPLEAAAAGASVQ